MSLGKIITQISLAAGGFILGPCLNVGAQARLVFGTSSDAYLVMSNAATTYTAGATSVYMVIGDGNSNVSANAITRAGSYGRIISNSEANIIKWYIGNSTGAYNIPWGHGTGAGEYIPFTFNLTTAGAANTGATDYNVQFATYRTGANNAAALPSGVTNDWSSACACNASPWMVDRFWMIDNTSYGAVGFRPTGDLTFYYVDGGATNPEVFTTGNTIVTEGDLQAESFSVASGLWAGALWGTDVPASNYVGSTGSIPTIKLDKWWALVDKNHPLPVEWLDVSASCEGKDMSVKWSTATEQDADYFTVERSADGNYFYPVDQIAASGNSSTVKNYTYLDTDPLPGTSFYQIKQTDFNGAYTRSGVITAKACEGIGDLNVFPNPVPGGSTFNVAVTGKPESEVLIVVTDMLGREFYSKVIILSSDKDVIAIDPSNTIAAGVYTVMATSNDEIFQRRIVIQ